MHDLCILNAGVDKVRGWLVQLLACLPEFIQAVLSHLCTSARKTAWNVPCLDNVEGLRAWRQNALRSKHPLKAVLVSCMAWLAALPKPCTYLPAATR